jgi:Rod binding domain-containing protein
MDIVSSITPPQGLADVDAFRELRADRAYKAFEAMFLQVMLKEMRKTVPGDEGIFPKSQATETFEEMLDAALAQNIADSGQFGIAKQLADEAARNEAGATLAIERNLQRTGLEALKALPGLADNP